ncbi:MAG TPA: crossover junction endodeoxyribonuclease RuvC [Gammaproteobacteria bacterium]
MTRILGIDPGSLLTGWAVIVQEGSRLQHVASGVIRTGGQEFTQRLRIIARDVAVIVAEHVPDEVVVERAFVNKNADSALKLGHARAAAICGTFAVDLPVFEYAPRDVKQAVVGTGAASKEQVQQMVGLLLKLKDTLQSDEADALAVALTHALRRSVNTQLAAVAGSTRTSRTGRRRR